jgi:hypothetical protein
MPLRIKLGLLWIVVGIIIGSWALSPWADVVSLVLVAAIAPPATLFAIVYGFTVPWWATTIGRAMLASSVGLALLVDISLLYQALGDNYALRDVVRLSVFAIVCLGAWYKLGALVREKWRAHRGRRADRLS